MICVGDAGDVGVGQFAMHAVDQRAELAGVDEECFAAAVACGWLSVAAGFRRLTAYATFAACQEPQADGNLRAVKELAGQRDHAVDQIGVDDRFADLSFARLIAAHAAVGQYEARETARRQVVDEVLHPGEVRVPLGGQAVLPPHVLVAAVPVRIVERRIGQHVIGLEVFVQVAAERVGVLGAVVAFDAANG